MGLYSIDRKREGTDRNSRNFEPPGDRFGTFEFTPAARFETSTTE